MGSEQLITAVVANEQGEIFDLEGYAAVGMAGESLFPLTDAGTMELPFGSELMRFFNCTVIAAHIMAALNEAQCHVHTHFSESNNTSLHWLLFSRGMRRQAVF